MNERIRDLLENHGFIHEGMTVGEKNDALRKFERFAEVIVLQCTTIVLNADVEDVDGGDLAVLSAAADQIRSKFGV